MNALAVLLALLAVVLVALARYAEPAAVVLLVVAFYLSLRSWGRSL